jgi:hypothetical protein
VNLLQVRIHRKGDKMKIVKIDKKVVPTRVDYRQVTHPGGINTPLRETRKCIKFKKNFIFISFLVLMHLFNFENRYNNNKEVIF